uniref:Uncharacterized protein n=1 Tax=Ascaris lumbricoides TaxID=6252 RepID=A0A0M3HS34_ASCLU
MAPSTAELTQKINNIPNTVVVQIFSTGNDDLAVPTEAFCSPTASVLLRTSITEGARTYETTRHRYRDTQFTKNSHTSTKLHQRFLPRCLLSRGTHSCLVVRSIDFRLNCDISTNIVRFRSTRYVRRIFSDHMPNMSDARMSASVVLSPLFKGCEALSNLRRGWPVVSCQCGPLTMSRDWHVMYRAWPVVNDDLRADFTPPMKEAFAGISCFVYRKRQSPKRGKDSNG